jgi:uncharacterized repeat protein (TIGR04042 family)
MQFVVRWPDETVTACYSPSLVVRDYLEVGKAYALDEFVERSRTALTIASERVREKYGFPCSSAGAQLAQIEAQARRFAASSEGLVTVEAFDPPASDSVA